MKIDMMESLGYSFLRHVQGCWIVQTNWKWPSAAFADVTKELGDEFRKMKERFGDSVFKQTETVDQLLKHAELDALGMTRDGKVHALEVAFHEQGLRYGRTIGDTVATDRKKMLRTYLVLKGLRYSGEGQHYIWFCSPKVRGGRAKSLQELFENLKSVYPDVHWRLCIDESVDSEILQETVTATERMSDTSELLLRARILLDVIEPGR